MHMLWSDAIVVEMGAGEISIIATTPWSYLMVEIQTLFMPNSNSKLRNLCEPSLLATYAHYKKQIYTINTESPLRKGNTAKAI